MKLKNVVAGAAVLLGASFAPTSGQATPVYAFTSSAVQFGDTAQYSLGFTFTANANVTVTSLGYFDEGGNGFLTPHEVGIFLGDGLVVLPGAPLVSTSLAAGMSGTLGPNNFRYSAITPLDLIAGQQYTIAGTQVPNETLNDPYLFGGPGFIGPFPPAYPATTGFSVVPQITIGPDAARYADGSSLVNPNQHFSNYQFYAVNFDVASVPEPSTLGLIGLGLVGLGAMAGRRARSSYLAPVRVNRR